MPLDKKAVAAQLHQFATQLEQHPDVAPQGVDTANPQAAPAWLLTLLQILAQVLPQVIPLIK